MIVVSDTSPLTSLAAISRLEILRELYGEKQRGVIGAVKPLVDDLIGRAGFWISPTLYQEVVSTAGE